MAKNDPQKKSSITPPLLRLTAEEKRALALFGLVISLSLLGRILLR
ncbi:MAG: hypothetical protein ACFCU4_10555 [Puniceicoccaceae bacterium]